MYWKNLPRARLSSPAPPAWVATSGAARAIIRGLEIPARGSFSPPRIEAMSNRSNEQPRDASSVEATVRAWWTAWQQKDRSTLERMALADYVEFTGHSDHPRVGRAVLLDVATRAFEALTILDWELATPVVRVDGGFAVAIYRWNDTIERGDETERRSGVSPDVLAWRGTQWHYLAHHSSIL